MKAAFLIFSGFFLIFSFNLSSQRYTISGYVTDSQSNERLIGVNVYESKSLSGTISNPYGFYSLSLPEGEYNLMFSHVGYEKKQLSVNLTENKSLNINLSIVSQEIEGVTIIGGKFDPLESTQMSVTDIPVEKLLKVPVLLGEADVMKVIQLLPGVQSGTEGTSGIYVRGGGPDQNLFLLDGVPVYNANHLFGFFSVFNPDAIKSVTLYKGSFPARYGERLSSVIDIRMKEGNNKEFHGNFNIGLIASKFSLEGPIIKDKTSFFITGRRTYADILAKPFIAAANNQFSESKTTGGYYFYDLNAKINHIFSEKSRLYLSSYIGQDKAYGKDKYTYDYYSDDGMGTSEYESNDIFSLGWGNIISALRWNYLISPKLFSNTTLTYSKYNFETRFESETKNLTEKTSNLDFFRYFSGIEDFAAKIDFDFYPTPKHRVKFGASYTLHNFEPGVNRFKIADEYENNIDTTFGAARISGNEIVGFIEDDYEITNRLKINAGLRLSSFMVQDVNYTILQPRFAIRYKAGKQLSLKAGYSKMTQFVHLLTTASINLPTDLWLPVTSNLLPPVSHQVALGGTYTIKEGWNLTVEGFYKTMENLIEYKEGAGFTGTGAGWETKVESGEGWAYGGELMLEKTKGKTTGWIGYTLSKTERKFENINFGKVFPAKYDRRHDISIVLTHKFSKTFDIGAVWVYGTGNTTTLALMRYPAMNFSNYSWWGYNESLNEYEGRNNYRVPAYHRFDIGLNFNKEKKRGLRTWSFSVYNAYNRQNPFFINWDESYSYSNGNYTSKTVLKQYSLFTIIPSVSYSFKF